MPTEFDFIHWIRSQQPRSERVPLPAGDDLAALNWPAGEMLLVGVDQVLDGVHFDASIHSPDDIGRKVMNRNLSDCAAMGCLPAAAVIAVALPRGVGVEYAKALYLGIKAAGDLFACAIVGGDTGSWAGRLAISVTILGRTGGVAPITRAGARPGDALYLTGPLGGSILGRHLRFTPRVAVGRALAEASAVHAMIDISDGLSRDAGHIAEQSRVGVVIEAERVPIHEDARTLAARDGVSALEHALHDGEDHELLIAASADGAIEQLAQLHGLTRIGYTIEKPGVWLRRGGAIAPLAAGAWEHQL